MTELVPTGTVRAGPTVLKRYRMGECTVFVSRDPIPNPGLIVHDVQRWHLSVSHPDRYPTWDELGDARDELIPEDVWMCMMHPPRAYWLNYRGHVLHLWEVDDPVLIAQCRAEGLDAQARGFGKPTREGE